LPEPLLVLFILAALLTLFAYIRFRSGKGVTRAGKMRRILCRTTGCD
jgi:hypothetical protein